MLSALKHRDHEIIFLPEVQLRNSIVWRLAPDIERRGYLQAVAFRMPEPRVEPSFVHQVGHPVSEHLVGLPATSIEIQSDPEMKGLFLLCALLTGRLQRFTMLQAKSRRRLLSGILPHFDHR